MCVCADVSVVGSISIQEVKYLLFLFLRSGDRRRAALSSAPQHEMHRAVESGEFPLPTLPYANKT